MCFFSLFDFNGDGHTDSCERAMGDAFFLSMLLDEDKESSYYDDEEDEDEDE